MKFPFFKRKKKKEDNFYTEEDKTEKVIPPTGLKENEVVPPAPKTEQPVNVKPKEKKLEVKKKKKDYAIYLHVHAYKALLDEMNTVNGLIKEADATINRLELLKDDEEKLFDKWNSDIQSIHEKLIFIDHKLFKGDFDE